MPRTRRDALFAHARCQPSRRLVNGRASAIRSKSPSVSLQIATLVPKALLIVALGTSHATVTASWRYSEQVTGADDPDRGKDDPAALPAMLADARPFAVLGTVAWVVAAVVLALQGMHGVWLWTCVAGALVGLGGMSLMHWQRGAARRGSRGAWLGLR